MKSWTAALIGLLFVASPANSHATTYYYSGALCGPARSSNDHVSIDALYGSAYNDSGNTNSMECAAGGWTSSYVALTSAQIDYEDNSSGTAIYCYWVERNWDLTLFYSSTLYSCSTWGGCSSNSQPSFTGSTALYWTNPITGLYPFNITARCTLPCSGGFCPISGITRYQVSM